jgi:6-phosphogluconolactonase
MKKIIVSGFGADTGQPAVAVYGIEAASATLLWSDCRAPLPFLHVDSNGFFAVAEENGGGLFRYEKALDGFVLQSVYPTSEKYCHLTYLPSQKTVYSASYQAGKLLALREEGGVFAQKLAEQTLDPQDGLTRAHCCALDPEGVHLYVSNIALDRIYCFNLKDGVPISHPDFPYLQLPVGTGVRHIKFHPILPLAYAMTEYSSQVLILKYNPENGTLQLLKSVSALPDGYEGTSYGSTLVFSGNGRYLYAANRGANTIAVFSADGCGEICLIQQADCGGDYPWHIDLSEEEDLLFVANKQSGTVSVIERDSENGKLGNCWLQIPFGAPSFVKEVTHFFR